ncbi:DUF4179 domain-containing protein [Virgibacillus doumboii]|uniref:DUF4179 domain-containing protein n=1 Tax=Virgibacillus doumboii TaxID=2697503 RepID=UPI0013DEC8BA|nr:DUF4179 domain-containing protein [Virgibacillus doumboii]
MSNKVKRELDKIEIPEEVHDRARMGIEQAKAELGGKHHKKRKLYKRLSLIAAAVLIVVSTFTFTPALAAIYDKIFSSEHIDDAGVRMAIKSGQGQVLDQTYYDEEHDIKVHFDTVLTDGKETKLLLTYQSDSTNLKNYYIDLFEGVSSMYLITGNGQKIELDNVGWGSRYYNSEENKVAEALSFDSIKEYEGQNLRLEIKNLTIWKDQGMGKVQTVWPLEFNLDEPAISDRNTVEVNKKFEFKGITYTIRRVEFSEFETRVVVVGSDTKIFTDENGMRYEVMSKIRSQFLNARENSDEYGYTFNENKSGVYLKSNGKQVVPIYSKGEVRTEDDEYVMTFAPVKDRQDATLVVGEDIEIPLVE